MKCRCQCGPASFLWVRNWPTEWEACSSVYVEPSDWWKLPCCVCVCRAPVHIKMLAVRGRSLQPWLKRPNPNCTRSELCQSSFYSAPLLHNPHSLSPPSSTRSEPTSRWSLPRPVREKSSLWWTQQEMWVSHGLHALSSLQRTASWPAVCRGLHAVSVFSCSLHPHSS